MKFKNIFICVIICTAIFSCKETVAQDQAKEISSKEMLKIIQSETVQLIDVRTPAEYSEGHIENAKNIDFSSTSFTKDITALDKEKPVFIYCRSGNRSGKSVKDFINAGFSEIYDLNGGMVEWHSEGFPVVID